MDLKEILPQKVELKLNGLTVPLFLRLFTLDDTQWIAEQWPGEKLAEVYREAKVQDILKILIRILDNDSKRFLSKLKIIEIDDRGEESELVGLTLAEKISKIATDAEIMTIIKSIFEVRQRSNEIAKNIAGELQDDKNGSNQAEIDQKKTKKKK